jgi:plastocyanin
VVRALRIGAGLGLAFLILTCTNERVAGPRRPGGLSLDLRSFAAPAAKGEPDIPVDSIRATLLRSDESVAFDSSFRVRRDTLADSAVLRLSVPLNQSSETFSLDVQAFGAGIVWYRLTTPLTLAEGSNVTPPPFTATYVGPGAGAARVQMLPADTTALGGATFSLHAAVFDSSGAPVPGVPIGYRLSDSTRGSLSVSYLTATFTGSSTLRDSLWIVAETPTHLRDSTRVHLLPPPTTLQKVSGDGQTGPVNVALAAPLVVRVVDALGGGFRGQTVSWSVSAGAASLSSATTPSDSNGNASVVVTPTGPGPVSVQAAVAGLVNSPVTFNATAATGAIAQVILDHTVDTIAVGATLTYTATLKDSAGNTVSGPVAWSSTVSATATVDPAGVATGKGSGTTSIIAAAGGHADTAQLFVRGIASVAVSPNDTVITAIGDSLVLKAVGLSNFGDTIRSGLTIRYTSATPTVATVNTVTGLVHLIGAGNAVVLAKDTVSGLQGSSTLRVNQVTTGLQSLPALPDSLQVGVGGRGQIVAKALDRNGYPISGRTFVFTSRNTGIVTVDATGLVTGVALGSAFVRDSVDGLVDSVKVAVVTTPPPLIQWAYDSVAVGNGGTISIALSLSRPDASPLVVKLSSTDTTVAKPTVKTVTFGAGTVATSVVIQGLAAGQVKVVASDSSGLGFLPDTMVVTVVSTIEFRDIGAFSRRSNFYVNQNETYKAQVFLSDPAPAGGLGVTFVYKTGTATVTPAPAIIPAGQLSADVVLAGLAPGRDSVVPTSGGFVGRFSYVDVAANNLALTLPYPYTGLLGVGQSFQPYVSITYGMDHPLLISASLGSGIGTVKTADTIAINGTSTYIPVSATSPGSTQLTVSAAGWNPASAGVTFTTPRLQAGGTTSIIAGNPSRGSWTAYTEDSLAISHPVAAPLLVTATSRDTNVVALDSAKGTVVAGQSAVNIPNALRAKPTAGGDSTWIVLTAPGYRPDSVLVHVTRPTLTYTIYAYPYDGRVGVGTLLQNAAYVSIPYVRPDTLWVHFTHSHASVVGHTSPDSVRILPSQTVGYFDIRGDSLGGVDTISVDTIRALASGYVVSGSPHVFTVDPIHVRPYTYPSTLYTISAPSQVNAYVYDSANGQARPLVAPLTVTLTSGNPQAFTLDSATVTIPAGAYISGYDTLRVVGVDSVGSRFFTSAPGSTPDSSNLIKVLPTPLSISLGYPYSVSRGLKLQSSRVYVTGGVAPDSVNVSLAGVFGTAVDSIVPNSVVIPKGQSSSSPFEVLGIDSTGTDTLVATATGYVPAKIALATQPSSLILGNPGTSHQTTDAATYVSTTTATRTGYGLKPYAPVPYTIVSTNPNVIVIDSAGSVNLAGDTATAVIDTASSSRYFKIRYAGPGTAQVIVSAPGFQPDTTPVITVTGPALHVAYTSVTVGKGQLFTGEYVYVDNAVTGQPLVVRLAKSDSTLPAGSQAFALNADSAVIPVGQYYTPAFDLAGQTSPASAQLIARASGYSQATATVQVGQPKLVASPATLNLPIGGQPVTVYVSATDQTGALRAVAADLTVSNANSDPTVVQADVASQIIAARSSQTTFAFSGLQKGSAQVVFSAAGYTPDTMVVQVDSGQIQIVNPPSALGPQQSALGQTYVQLSYATATPVTVNLASSNPSVLTVTPSVVIPPGSNYAYFDVQGVAIGTATISATSPDAKAATPVAVRISKPALLLSLTTVVTTGVHYGFAVYTADSLGTPRLVTAPVTISLASSDPTKTVFDSAVVHVDSGGLAATSGVRFDTAGTYLVVATAPNYTPDTVTVSAGGAFVAVGDNFYVPDTVTIKVGNYVTWFNSGPSVHTTTSDTGVWNSGNIAVGGSYSAYFGTPGTYPYHCLIHGAAVMSGTVVVTP